jgi:hypothetical protein
MPTQVTAWLGAHGIVISSMASAVAGMVFKHFWPQIKVALGANEDKMVIQSLSFIKKTLKSKGATDAQVADLTNAIVNALFRAAQDIQKDQS